MKQHYIPRVYLKNFASRIDGDEFFVNVFDKKLNKHKEINIKNICAEKHLYTLPESTKVATNIFAIEKLYSDFIEPMYQRAYQILTNNNISAINDFQRGEILTGIFQLYMRNPRFLKKSAEYHTLQINELYKEALTKNAKGLSYLDEDFSFKEWSKEQIIKYFINLSTKLFKEKHIIGIQEMISFHADAVFEINIVKDESQYMTSDNPIVTEDIISEDEHPLLRSKEFFVPLNKKFMLRIFHDNTLSRNLIHRRFVPNGNIHSTNQYINNQSTRFIIADKKTFEDYAELEKIFNSTSIELKISSIKQILEDFPITEETREATELLRDFYQKYSEGKITKYDEHEMMTKMKALNVNLKKRKIK
ncbi:DUF4238 domain-containing protein [Flavobacterium anhuiense]|uniref:DUF4238 domain-containing protein n=1 Tax=Flavobacterium anhuiense TaxID=459526 RepID=UPI000E6CA18A|nr:DUF4238 domain-containing protein [Flavobacterium anhuiense]